MTTSAQRRSGRAERLRMRAGKPVINPSPPGPRGGMYKPLSNAEIEQIVQAAIDLLARLGMGDVPDRLCTDLIQAGAREIDGGRLSFPEGLVQAAIDKAAQSFVLHGRDDSRSITIGGDRVFFGTGGAAVQVLDMKSGLYRPSTLGDLHDFTRLQDTLENIGWFTRCCVATDVPDVFDLDLNTAYALVRHTTKPVATSFTLAAHVAPIVEMLDIAAGGAGAFRERPFLKGHISPIISPMRYGEDAVDVVYACIDHNIPISCITAAQAGATAPASLAGFLVQSLAETLASLVMVHAIEPGFPMVFSNWPFVVDLRTGAFSGGNPETAIMNAASAQLSNHLGLPSGVAASMTDAKAIDAQYGMEKGITSLAAALAGANLVYESAGMTASLLGASFEGFVLDDEMHANTYRILRGVEVNAETLDLQVIQNAVLGEGHFLGAESTLHSMERDYVYPSFADRTDPRSWGEAGARDVWQVAKDKAQSILDTHHPTYLDPTADRLIRSKFNIL